MTNITKFVYQDGDRFYFDPENYTEEVSNRLSISYEDGDIVKWIWEGKKMLGVLREEGHNLGLFRIEDVKEL